MNGTHALVHDQTVGGENPRSLGVEVVGEQRLAHPDRIGAVDDDRIERAGIGLANVFDAVADDHFGARIVPCRAADLGQKFAGEANNLTINLDHHRPPHGSVLQHSPQHAAVAGPDNQDIGATAMRHQRHVRDHLLIHELVPLRDLDGAIEHHHTAMTGAFKDYDFLKGAFPPREFADYPEALSPILVQRLVQPNLAVHRHVP